MLGITLERKNKAKNRKLIISTALLLLMITFTGYQLFKYYSITAANKAYLETIKNAHEEYVIHPLFLDVDLNVKTFEDMQNVKKIIIMPTNSLYFAVLGPGLNYTRTIQLVNPYPYKLKIITLLQGDIAPFITKTINSTILEPNSEIQLKLLALIPLKTKEGSYTGNLTITFTPQLQ